MTDEIKRDCMTCQYMTRERGDPKQIETVPVCRRHPPVLAAMATPQGLGVMTTFPVVNPQSWCYEYAPKALDRTLV